MHPLRALWILPLLALPLTGSSDRYPRDYFRSPLDIPLSLSGNFAEMRSNHFHTGLDIRTNGQVGYRIHAAADGWIARVAVSPGGYGNALYVNHPNGYQTVYAHLDRFEGPVADYVESAQYARRSFAVDLYPSEGRFPVKQGEVIAISGNSGSSGGPHLHFEIRESATADPVNPLLFGMPVVDTTRPRLYRIKLYPEGRTSRVRVLGSGGRVLDQASDGGSVSVTVEAAGAGRYALRPGTRIEAAGRVGFGIQTTDFHDLSSGRLGVYRIRLTAGERPVFESEMEKLDFALQRYLNAHVDYEEHSRNGRWIQRSHLLPGNRLQIYRTERSGYVEFEAGDTLTMQYDVEDAYGNAVSLAFTVRGMEEAGPAEPDTSLVPVAWNHSATIERPGIVIRIPDGALYASTGLRYAVESRRAGAFSAVHRVHDEHLPIHAPVSVSIEVDSLPEALQSRALVARRTRNGSIVSHGGSWQNGSVTAQVRTLGDFFVAVDTTAPEIGPLNVRDGADLSGTRSIRFRIRDDLSGIESYEGLVDGEWVLFGYDAKSNLIEYTFDGRVARGSHVLEVRVVDGVGNRAAWRGRFTR
jgi:hypothetical protein